MTTQADRAIGRCYDNSVHLTEAKLYNAIAGVLNRKVAAQKVVAQVLYGSVGGNLAAAPYTLAHIAACYNSGSSLPVTDGFVIHPMEDGNWLDDESRQGRFRCKARFETQVALAALKELVFKGLGTGRSQSPAEAFGPSNQDFSHVVPGEFNGAYLPTPTSRAGDLFKLHHAYNDSLIASGYSVLHPDRLTHARATAARTHDVFGQQRYFDVAHLIEHLGGQEACTRAAQQIPDSWLPDAKWAAEGLDGMRHEVRCEDSFLVAEPFEAGGLRRVQRAETIKRSCSHLYSHPRVIAHGVEDFFKHLLEV
jgi:hypothetical protein